MRSDSGAIVLIGDGEASSLRELAPPRPLIGSNEVRPTVAWAGEYLVYSTSAELKPMILAGTPVKRHSRKSPRGATPRVPQTARLPYSGGAMTKVSGRPRLAEARRRAGQGPPPVLHGPPPLPIVPSDQWHDDDVAVL